MAESLALVRVNLRYRSKLQTEGYTVVLLATALLRIDCNWLPLVLKSYMSYWDR